MDCTTNNSKLTREHSVSTRSRVGRQQEVFAFSKEQDFREEANECTMLLWSSRGSRPAWLHLGWLEKLKKAVYQLWSGSTSSTRSTDRTYPGLQQFWTLSKRWIRRYFIQYQADGTTQIAVWDSSMPQASIFGPIIAISTITHMWVLMSSSKICKISQSWSKKNARKWTSINPWRISDFQLKTIPNWN